MTINKVCGSGLKAVHLAAQAIAAGDADVVVAGGFENMSQAPYILKTARDGFRMGDQKVIDSMIHDGLWCAFNNYHMGITAENLCDAHSITREEQDAFAARSQARASEAIAYGKFVDEIVPVEIPQRKGEPIVFDEDEYVKEVQQQKSLAAYVQHLKKMVLLRRGMHPDLTTEQQQLLLCQKNVQRVRINTDCNDCSKCECRCRSIYYGNWTSTGS